MIKIDSYNDPVIFPGDELSRTLAEKYQYKEWMISRFLNYVPDTEELLKYVDTNDNLHTYIRVNTLKVDPVSLKTRLLKKGFKIKNTLLDEVFEICKLPTRGSGPDSSKNNFNKQGIKPHSQNSSCEVISTFNQDQIKTTRTKLPSIGSTFEYLKGFYYIQDLSSCVAVSEMDISPSAEAMILDMAAAPGGKTTHIAQKMNNLGTIVACESNPTRLPSLVFNLSRCGVKNTAVLKMKSDEVDNLGLKFDRVLLDAPCTCEGVILKDKSRKKSRNINDLKICSEKQRRMIHSGFKVLKPDGIMIYSTCSFAPEENEMIIQYLLDKFTNAMIEPLNYGSSGLTKFHDVTFSDKMNLTKRFYPHHHDTNGFFIAKIRKVSGADEV